MDSLDDLPSDAEDSQLDEKQREALDKYLGKQKKKKNVNSIADGAGKSHSLSSSNDETSVFNGEKWKTIGYLVVVFIIVANPWIQGMIKSNSYINDSSLMAFGVSIALFVVATIIVVLFL